MVHSVAKFLAAAALVFSSVTLSATVIHVTPDNYKRVISRLKPGDTVLFGPGVYQQGLWIEDLNGKPRKPITLEGAGGRPVFVARPGGRDIIVIRNSSFLTLRNLEIDGRGVMVNGVRASGRFAHYIVLEDLFIHDLGRH